MKLLGKVAAAVVFIAGAVLFTSSRITAHEGNEHVRGVVTAISATSIAVETAPKTTKTLTVTAKTVFTKSGKPAKLDDVKVGDRVVIDVPEHTTEAKLVQFGAPAKP